MREKKEVISSQLFSRYFSDKWTDQMLDAHLTNQDSCWNYLLYTDCGSSKYKFLQLRIINIVDLCTYVPLNWAISGYQTSVKIPNRTDLLLMNTWLSPYTCY